MAESSNNYRPATRISSRLYYFSIPLDYFSIPSSGILSVFSRQTLKKRIVPSPGTILSSSTQNQSPALFNRIIDHETEILRGIIHIHPADIHFTRCSYGKPVIVTYSASLITTVIFNVGGITVRSPTDSLTTCIHPVARRIGCIVFSHIAPLSRRRVCQTELDVRIIRRLSQELFYGQYQTRSRYFPCNLQSAGSLSLYRTRR